MGILLLVVYIAALFSDLMAPDAAQYAEMSWEMLRTGSFLKLHFLGADYLDKPPLLFWLNALSFYFLGAGNVAYKLPSLVFALLGTWSCYRFARLYYPEQTAVSAALMLGSTVAFYLMVSDVRTDTMLMGSVMFAIWQGAAWTENLSTSNMLLAFLGLGLGMLAKGPIAVIGLTASLLPQVLLRNRGKALLSKSLVFGFIILALLLAPMCMGLFQQYGLNGLKFYFWTQSFGRITGENSWRNHPDTFFLLHSTAWAFLPWTLFLFPGWVRAIALLIYPRWRSKPKELISASGFTLVTLALMFSKYQLPHYIFVVYPLAAVIAADFMQHLKPGGWAANLLLAGQILILLAALVIASLLQYSFLGTEPFSMFCLPAIFLMAAIISWQLAGPIKNPKGISVWLFQVLKSFWGEKPLLSPEHHTLSDYLYRNLLALTIPLITAFYLLLAFFYFPAILKYQPAADFGRYIRSHPRKAYVTYAYGVDATTTFYARKMPDAVLWASDSLENFLKQKDSLLLLTNADGFSGLSQSRVFKHGHVLYKRPAFPVSSISLPFLLPSSREKACRELYLLEMKNEQAICVRRGPACGK